MGDDIPAIKRHPIREEGVQAEIERRSLIITCETAGKMVVEFNYKDGKWTLGNVSVTFPRRRET